MLKWREFRALAARAVAGAVDLRLETTVCLACGGSGMRLDPRGPLPLMADDECRQCDGFGWVLRLREGGGSDLRGWPEGSKGLGAGKFYYRESVSVLPASIILKSKGQNFKTGSGTSKIFRVKKGAAGGSATRAVSAQKNKKGAPEAASAQRAKRKKNHCRGCGFEISNDSTYCGECLCEEDGI
jgi:hypothetical protein